MKQQYEVKYLVVTRTTPLSCPTEFILFITKVTLYLGFLGQILDLPSKLGELKLKLELNLNLILKLGVEF